MTEQAETRHIHVETDLTPHERRQYEIRCLYALGAGQPNYTGGEKAWKRAEALAKLLHADRVKSPLESRSTIRRQRALDRASSIAS